ncbi:MAG: hypothetical protein SPK28_03940 [Bacilli bacterium]|nr:hypothetical protein [Bacilli bacterium]
MYFDDDKYLNNLDFINRNLLNNSFTSVASSNLLTNDTFYYDRNTFTVKGKSTTDKRGSICVKYDNVKSGDIIEVECEIRRIDGDMPSVAITECDTTHESNYNELCKKRYNLNGDWQLIKIKTTMLNDKSLNITFGLGLDQTGTYEVRYVKTRVKRVTENALVKINKSYAIYKMPNGWQVRTDTFDSDYDGVITLQDTNTLLLTYDRFKLSPIPSVAENFDNNGIKYDVRVGQVQNNSIQIKVVDRTTNTLVDLSTLSNYFQFYITLTGYKYI